MPHTIKAHRFQRQLLALERAYKELTQDIAEYASGVAGCPQDKVDAFIAARAHAVSELKNVHDAGAELCLSVGIQPLSVDPNKEN